MFTVQHPLLFVNSEYNLVNMSVFELWLLRISLTEQHKLVVAYTNYITK